MFSDTLNEVFNFSGDAIVFGGVCVGVCMWGGGGIKRDRLVQQTVSLY